MASAAEPSASALYPSLSDEKLGVPASDEPLLGYPAEGQPVYGYAPSLPYHRERRRCCRCNKFCGRTCGCVCFLLVILIAVAAFFVWPRSLSMSVDDISLGKIHFVIKREGGILPSVYLNLTINLKLEAENPNYFSATYETIIVSLYYDGDELGEVESHGGSIGRRSTSSVDAVCELNGNQIASNVLSIIADYYFGAIPVQTIVTFNGHLNVLWFKIPLEADVTCDLLIDTNTQELASTSCSL